MKINDCVRLLTKGAIHLAATTSHWSCANDAMHEFVGYVVDIPCAGVYLVEKSLNKGRFLLDFDMIRTGRYGDRYFGRGDVKVVSSDRNKAECPHLCTVCGEEPYLSGDRVAVKVNMDGTGFHWGFCGYCIKKMYKSLMEGNAK